MNIPATKRTKSVKKRVQIPIERLFWAMAYDMKVQHDKDIIDLYALLCQGKYMSFVKHSEAICQQMYDSVGDLNHRKLRVATLLSKYPFDDPDIDRDAVAIRKFEKSEHRCRRMNQKLRLRRQKVEPPHMQFMRDYIRSVIGESPDMAAVYSGCDFGPGSSVGVHGAQVDVLSKLEHLSVTPALIPVALAALLANPLYAQKALGGQLLIANGSLSLCQSTIVCYDAGWLEDNLLLHRVQYNKIVCVPKNAKTNRTIAIEPTLNGYVQKGIDLLLRKKLARIGINLGSQALNQALAKLGSQGRGYATMDLSAASDSISIELARDLLPADWFALLNCARSPSYSWKGTVKRYEKFCSMGNGFCFPLETLIFRAAMEYALSRTLVHRDKTCGVFGDDIIVPQECALLLAEVLHDLGFTLNRDKTFIFGAFRESCGADYFNGVNVRDVYVKQPLYADHTSYPLLNDLRRRKLMHSWRLVFEQIPVSRRYVRPYDLVDDTAITVDLDTFMASRFAKWSRSTFSWSWQRAVASPRFGRKPVSDVELLIGKLRGDLSFSESFTARFSERTRVTRTC